MERKTITNVKYYVAMLVGIEMVGSRTQIAEALAHLPNVSVDSETLSRSLRIVLDKYTELGSSDQVAKGSDLVTALLE